MDNPPIKTETVELLLRGRPPLPRESDCDEMAKVAQAVCGFEDPKRLAEARRHLEGCPVCRDAVLTLFAIDGMADGSSIPVDISPRPLGSVPRSRILRRKTFAVAASLLLVTGLCLLAVLQSLSTTPSGDDLRIKGAADSFFVGVRRGPHRFSAEPFDKLEENDRLGMFYSAERDGFLMVVSMDSSRTVSLLHPVGEARSGVIRSGREVSLSDGALVQAGTGCEWIVAAFSDVPIPLTDLTRALKTAKVSERPCDIEVSIPGARTVRILPFTR